MVPESIQLERATKAIVATLPAGWTVVTQQSGEIPYGHHWDENYTGPKGTLLVLKGTRPLYAEFADPSNAWHAVHVATEGLNIWLMPSDYSNSRFSWLSFKRPIQPKVLLARGPLKIYAAPKPILIISEKEFFSMADRSRGVRWQDPQGQSPEFLAGKDWKLKEDWRSKLQKALEREFK